MLDIRGKFKIRRNPPFFFDMREEYKSSLMKIKVN